MALESELVCVITAATGHRHLGRCLRSVQAQTLASVSHCVVIDGPEHRDRVTAALRDVAGGPKQVRVLQLPQATGGEGWICHRIYGAAPFLVNSAWVSFLDEDNWFDADHLESLLSAVASASALWGHSLRKICDAEGQVLGLDECESLGTLHPVFSRNDLRLVDTNCYLLRRDVAIAFCPIWNRPRRSAGMPPDLELCRTLLANRIAATSNIRHTVNYTVGNTPGSVQWDFFQHGNAQMRERYPDGLPWELAPPQAGSQSGP